MVMEFAPSQRSTVGIEWELQLLDRDSNDLRQCGDIIVEAIHQQAAAASAPQTRVLRKRIHKEMLLNTVEVVSGANETISQCGADLAAAIAALKPITAPLRIELAAAGSHPFANPAYQRVTNHQRYSELVERTQYWGRQMLLYGTHVHVGIENRDKVLPILNALLTRFAQIQSLAASSPYWAGDKTGYASNRAMIFQQLPTAGTPRQFETWEEIESHTNDLLKTGVIESFNEIRWDIRPSPKLGTIEVRVADAATNLTETLAVAALTHCLVEYYSRQFDAGQTLPRIPDWYVAENKWRSARYGMDAILILDAAGNEEHVTATVRTMLDELAPIAADLGCSQNLHDIELILTHGAAYQRMETVAQRHGNNLEAVTNYMRAEMEAGTILDPHTFELAHPDQR